jgi:hypothetical protein
MLTNRTLACINDRPREVGRLLLLAVGGGALALALAALLYVFGVLPPLAILAVLGVGALLVLLLYLSRKSKVTISLSYEDTLSVEAASRFSEVREVLEGLASSEGIWRLPLSSKPPKAGQIKPTPEREPVRIGLLPTPGIRADVPIWGIEAGDGRLFFFPEGALFYENDRYEPIPYKALKMALASGRFLEEEGLPGDAKVEGHAWRHGRVDGSPNPRHGTGNGRIPIVVYTLLAVDGPFGLGLRLMVSDRRAAVRFALAFGAEEPRKSDRVEGLGGPSSGEGREGYRPAEVFEREVRLVAACKTLGIREGATKEEIGAAYRKLALTHHPDRVAILDADVRKYSERRMKEINLAYAELKGQGGHTVRGARPG